MTSILVVGAGKSSPVLIKYLLDQAQVHTWRVVVADASLAAARARVGGHPHGEAVELDVDGDALRRRQCVRDAAVVVSLLPPDKHIVLVQDCLEFKRHFVSASYTSPQISALDTAAQRAGITVLNEMGLDPGIDHMASMEALDGLRAQGARIAAFETFAGGLVAPRFDTNPWGYKITWNPRNVVLAGQGGARFKHNGRFKHVPYHKIFCRYETLSVPGYGDFEAYPNRDSLAYRYHYDLWDVQTIYRGTLRRPGFCKAWDCLVQLGLTDDSYLFEDVQNATYRQFVNAYLWFDPDLSVELKLKAYLKMELNSPEFDKLAWLGLFEDEPIGLSEATPAQILQKRLEEKLAMQAGDQDMVVLVHRIVYQKPGENHFERLQSAMVAVGDDAVHTAMAKTVGLPLGIAAKLLATKGLNRPGVIIPTLADVYKPVLRELRELGIEFSDHLSSQSHPYVP